MSAAMIEPAPSIEGARKSQIGEVLAGSFIDLIEMAPANPYVRALILNQTGRMPPSDYLTFAQIKDWVETTCEKKRVPPSRSRNGGEGISIEVDFSETEYGKARYIVTRSGSEQFKLDADDLLEIVETAIEDGNGIEKIVKVIDDKIREDGWEQCEPSMDNYGDYDYDDHESNDSDSGRIEFASSQIREKVMTFLRNNHPALADQL
jgi:hypothetical protein